MNAIFYNSKMWLTTLSAILFTVFTFLISTLYVGSTVVHFAFNLTFLCMMIFIFVHPRSYAYLFFATFLFLGFWMKFTIHNIIDYDFLEPVGEFDGKPESWDLALKVASSAALGVCLSRVPRILLSRNLWLKNPTKELIQVNRWFLKHRSWIYVFTFLFLITCSVWNFKASFYQIGINPKTILPAHLNVIMAWLIHSGFAMILCLIVFIEEQNRGLNPVYVVILFVLEGMILTISALSRSIYLFHVLPILVVFAYHYTNYKSRINTKSFITILMAFFIGLITITTTVTIARIKFYKMETTAIEEVKRDRLNDFLKSGGWSNNEKFFFDDKKIDKKEIKKNLLHGNLQLLLKLVVDRWIGLEGLLAVSSYYYRGIPLFISALKENPKKGVDSIYQHISNSQYKKLSEYTFLTLPGIIAILYYSGSLTVVFIGAFFISSFLMLIESVVLQVSQNHFLAAVLGLALANIVCQLNFPYTGIVNVAILFLTGLIIAVVHRFIIQT